MSPNASMGSILSVLTATILLVALLLSTIGTHVQNLFAVETCYILTNISLRILSTYNAEVFRQRFNPSIYSGAYLVHVVAIDLCMKFRYPDCIICDSSAMINSSKR